MKVEKIRVESNYTIFPKNMNRHNTLFGGQILYWLDEVTSMTIRKYSRLKFVTASVDSYQFIDAVYMDEILKIKSYISRVGNRSVEIFAEVSSYCTKTDTERLVGLSFMTFALMPNENIVEKLEEIEYENPLEIFVAQSYNDRKNNIISSREFTKEYMKKYKKMQESK
ncbi:MAG: acyl-CoA thioesterase [Gemella sp.]|nr:acyl-CoA thioesterase [Gemella sp.]